MHEFRSTGEWLTGEAGGEPRGVDRNALLRRGVRLNAALLTWNVIEGFVAVGFGLVAGSVALITFGIDSFIEVTSAAVVTWRLWRELRGASAERTERLERVAARVTGSLLLLAMYVVIDAGRRLLGYGEDAGESIPGIALTAVSVIFMPLLGWAKLRVADGLGSRALRADAVETLACAWLSVATLIGLSLNAAFGWTWADPVAALATLPLVIREGADGVRGEACGDECRGQSPPQRAAELNERPGCRKSSGGETLCGCDDPASASGQRLKGADCRLLSQGDPVFAQLIEVWTSLPTNIRKAVEALCLQRAF